MSYQKLVDKLKQFSPEEAVRLAARLLNHFGLNKERTKLFFESLDDVNVEYLCDEVNPNDE